MANPRVSLNFAPGPQPTITGEDNEVEHKPAGFIVWSNRVTGGVIAVAELGDPIAHDDHDPLLWDGDQA